MIECLIAGLIGFFLGIVASCIMLAKKNVAAMKQVENAGVEGVKSAASAFKEAFNEKYETQEEPETVSYVEAEKKE